MTDAATPESRVPPEIEKILRRFATLSPDIARQALAQYAMRLPPVPERFQHLDRSEHRVNECLTPVDIFSEVVDGKLYFYADVAPSGATLRALLAIIFDALNGKPPETVLAIPPDFVRQVMGQIGLATREAGLNAMVERLKGAARRAIAERDSRTTE